MKIRHFGNVANNAFQNVLLLDAFAPWRNILPIQLFGLKHAISAPAWEEVDFDPPSADWVVNPNWSLFPEAQSINLEYTDGAASGLTQSSDRVESLIDETAAPPQTMKQVVFDILNSTFLAPQLSRFQLSRALRAVPETVFKEDEVAIVYGSVPPMELKTSEKSGNVVALEHGTIRWIADGPEQDSFWRKEYRQRITAASHVWVTNLDLRTLELAEDLVPGKWSAMAHPFMFDRRVPYDTDEEIRESLLLETDSDFLILMASSQNWSTHHNKGSIRALESFIELRKRGLAVGLIAVEWGAQLSESRDLLEREGLSHFVKWVTPMPRHGMQRMMANVDAVWDQFGMDAFGALALRTLEQGTPLISSGISEEAAALIGKQVPWIKAQSTEEIVTAVCALHQETKVRGREQVIGDSRSIARDWLERFHSPQITAQLQADVYRPLVAGEWGVGDAKVDAWARANTTRFGN